MKLKFLLLVWSSGECRDVIGVLRMRNHAVDAVFRCDVSSVVMFQEKSSEESMIDTSDSCKLGQAITKMFRSLELSARKREFTPKFTGTVVDDMMIAWSTVLRLDGASGN